MVLFRAEDRLPEDPRVLVVDRLDDFSLFQNRKELGISAIACPYDPFTPEQNAELKAWAVKFAAAPPRKNRNETLWMDGKPSRILSALPDAFQTGMPVFRDTYNFALGTRPSGIETYVNYMYPKRPHRHDPALIYTFLEAATDGYDAGGRRYGLPSRHVIMPSEDYYHSAPQYHSLTAPRVSALAF